MHPESSPVSDAFNQVVSFFNTIIRRFIRNFKASFTQVDSTRWTKVILIVIGYILVRPYIERFFKYMHDRDRAKEKAKAKAKADAEEEEALKARISANELRGAGSSGSGEGKVLGEVDADEEAEVNEVDDTDDEGKASGVPEWGKLARKRQKKYLTSVQKGQQQRTEALTDSRMLELLDWSESEEEKGDAS